MRPGRAAAAALASVGLVTLLGACDDDRRAISRDDLPVVDDEPGAEVTVDDDGFDPDAVEVEAGQIIRVTNEGDEGHGVVLPTGSTTGLLEPGESVDVVLREPGEHVLIDVADDGHELTVTVTEAAEP